MIERVARILYPNAFVNECNCEDYRKYKEIAKEVAFIQAIEVIRAMKEPTEAMLEAGPPEPYMDKEVWAKMIEAALT